MFRIKICGITNLADALFAVAEGADALGLNFYSPSPRCISVERAHEIASGVRGSALPKPATIVGVFVNETERHLLSVIDAAGLDAWQLHGDEPASLVASLPAMTIRAFRCREQNLSSVSDFLHACQTAGGLPHAVLLDAYAPNAFGGTGQVVDWNVVRNEREKLFGLPVILAGGLTPDNVAAAIRTARPDAVDVASGVESSPGKKDPSKVRDFIAAAKGAFEEIRSST